MQRAPLCMSSLLLKLRASHGRGFKAGLVNHERNVLMTFLQASGVEQKVSTTLFWDLAGLDEKSFQSKYGKSIDYFSKKDYKSFGCAKIQETGLCPFQSKNRALALVKAANITVDIEECFKLNPPPCVSCSLYYKKCQGSGWDQVAVHNPKTYFFHALGEPATGKRARSPDVEAGEPAAKRAQPAPLTDEQRARIAANREAALERRRLHTAHTGGNLSI
jgi:DNA primase large subunit